MEKYSYEPLDLDRPALRLLRLRKGEYDDDIHCELFQAYLYGDEIVPYEALSYTWGDKKLSSTMSINEKELGITGNLDLALRYLRSREIDRILWADAVCINQANDKERGHQVQQMGEIYSQAENVIFWLGLATYESNVLMDSLKRFEQEGIQMGCRSWSFTDKKWRDLWGSLQPGLRYKYSGLESWLQKGIEDLLNRPWFDRVWIIQEVANAKKAVVCSGPKSISAYVFALAPSLFKIIPRRHCQSVLDIMPGISRNNSWWNQKRDLRTLLRKFSQSKASDPRDKIYAILGITSDARNSTLLRSDYEKSSLELIRNTARFLFGRSDVLYETISEFVESMLTDSTRFVGNVLYAPQLEELFKDFEMNLAEGRAAEEIVELVASSNNGERLFNRLLSQQHKRNFESTMEAALTEQETVEILKCQKVFTDDVLSVLIEYSTSESDVKALQRLLRNLDSELTVSEEASKVASKTLTHAHELIELLIQYCGNKALVTERMVEAVAMNRKYGKEMLKILIQHWGNELPVTERVVQKVVRNSLYGKEMLEILSQHWGNKLPVTENVLRATIPQRFCRLLKLQLRHSDFKIT